MITYLSRSLPCLHKAGLSFLLIVGLSHQACLAEPSEVADNASPPTPQDFQRASPEHPQEPPQEQSPRFQKRPQENLQQHLQSLTDHTQWQGSFEQTKTLKDLNLQLASTGSFSYADKKLIWQVKQPITTELTITTDAIVQSQNGKETFRVDAKDQPMINSVTNVFLAMFSGQWQQLEPYFEKSISGSQEQWQITLTPRNNNIERFAKMIYLRGGEQLSNLTLEEANGDETTIVLHITSQD